MAAPETLRLLLFCAFFIGFAIKVPTFPFHTWLPDAHVEAPTPISMILAGVLLKMGGYGLIRMAYPFFPDAARHMGTWVVALSLISIVYGALVAMAQTDFKKLVAYSSVSHMGFVTLGLASMTNEGASGAMYMMLAHGTISAMLFAVVGVIYDRAHTRQIDRFGGLAWAMPAYGLLVGVRDLREPRAPRPLRLHRRDHGLPGLVRHLSHAHAGRDDRHGRDGGLLPGDAPEGLSGRHAARVPRQGPLPRPLHAGTAGSWSRSRS